MNPTRTPGVVLAAAIGAIACALPATPALADSTRTKQWHLAALDVTAAQKISKGDGVTVALVDTGVAEHRDLTGALITGTSVFPGQTGDGRKDVNGHGTEMAGLIAGRGHGAGDGVLGIAPNAKILPIRIPIEAGSNGNYIAAAVDYAIAHHAGVINMSFGMEDDDPMHEAILKAQAANIVVVASAGNKGKDIGAYPGKYPEVLTVGAYGKSGSAASFSVTGPQLDLVAPGADLVTTGNDGGYYDIDGTSGAAAIVSGAAALLRAKYPDLSAAEIAHRLTATATDAGAKGRDDVYGYGRLNLVKALSADLRPLSPSAPPATQAAAAAPAGRTSEESGNSGLVIAVLTGTVILVVGVIVLGVKLFRGASSG